MRIDFEYVDLKDHRTLEEIVRFCLDAGLSGEGDYESKIVSAVIIRDGKGIAATSRLEMIFDRPFVEGVAVRDDLRGKGLGRKIVEEMIAKAKNLNYRRVWIAARAPEFFKKLGFISNNDEELGALVMNSCRKCNQYLKECNPEILMMDP